MSENPRFCLKTEHISMEFPGVKALSDINMEIKSGKVHAVIGANGAGKSTLMKVLGGVNAGYTGQILINGERAEIRTTAKAKQLGIEVVYQEVDMALISCLTVAENIMFNTIINGMKRRAFINWNSIYTKAEAMLERVGIAIDVHKHVSELSLAEKQMVLLARAICEKCRLLVLDEPTAPLSTKETKDLFKIIRDLMAKEEIAIVFISHRLQEILQICDYVTVMRDGAVVKSFPMDKSVDLNYLVKLMLGRSLNAALPDRKRQIGEKTLEAVEICDKKRKVNGVSLYVRKGEIVGISGLVGAGKTELSKLLFGAAPKSSGKIFYNGKEQRFLSTTSSVRQGIGLIPEERRKEGIFIEEPVYFNLSAACLHQFTDKLTFVHRKKEIKNSYQYITMLGIKTPGVFQRLKLLSGGNQQKVVIGKWLAAKSGIYIMDEPTKGVDVGAKQDIYTLIQELANNGNSILYITSETGEIMSLTDRVYVMYDGKINAALETAKTTEEEILYYAAGGN